VKIAADFHCHTIASVHAYSTIRENIDAAKRLGLLALGITDHGYRMPEGPALSFFKSISVLPDHVEGLRLLKGVEANIMDFNGTLDMPEDCLKKLDYTIASFHEQCVAPGTMEDHTRAYLAVAENPYVRFIGHPGTPEYSFDYEKVLPVFKKNGKIVEINSHTFICRRTSIPNCRRIAELCKKYEVPVAVNSDAHSEWQLGTYDAAIAMLEDIDFPEELIINSGRERVDRFLAHIGVRGL
jgi:putative hydrolase